MLLGYALLTVILLGSASLLTHALDGSVGAWDENVNEYFARHRTDTLNDVTKFATAAFNTVPVVLGASVVVGILALRRRWSEAAFLTLALVLEITVFLSVTFVVARPRPAVHRLNSTPATSSFPSGHTAAATVLFVGIALIVACCTRNTLARPGARSWRGSSRSSWGSPGSTVVCTIPPTSSWACCSALPVLTVAALAVRAHGGV
jgi:undecaprenyl-diphosphatase